MSLERSFAINSCSPDNTEKDLLEGLLLARGGGQLVCAQEVGESVAKEGSDYIYGLQIPDSRDRLLRETRLLLFSESVNEVCPENTTDWAV